MSMWIIRVAFAAAVIAILAACVGCNTIDGVGRDLQIAARSTAETER